MLTAAVLHVAADLKASACLCQAPELYDVHCYLVGLLHGGCLGQGR